MTTINPEIFKAYDVRGIYPSDIHEDLARDIGRAFVAYLGARRIAVGRDMRVSSPTLAAAFIDGARAQGADVVDYGLIGTDMLYYAAARDGHDGGAQITASHNPKQYNGVKLVGRQCHVDEGATIDGAILWANTRIGREALVRDSILGRQCHIGRSAVVDGQAVLGDRSVVTDYSSV